MQTYINKYWDTNNRRRFYEATTVCFAVAEGDSVPNQDHWQATEENIPPNMEQVRMEAGVRYYGHL